MPVTSATTQLKLTATKAEPPKKSAPAQPWQATGFTAYHNDYVNRAADLGCCGVIHLLITGDNSLPNRVGKMALFAIASFGFAMVDVIRAAWTKISGKRDVVPVTPVPVVKPTTTAAVTVSATATATIPSKPEAATKPKQPTTSTQSTGDQTQVEAATATPKAPKAKVLPPTVNYDSQAIQRLTNQANQNARTLAGAIEELRGVMECLPSTATFVDGINQVRRGANKAAKEFAERLSTNQGQLTETNDQIGPIEKSFDSTARRTEKFLKFADTTDPNLISRVAPALWIDHDDAPVPPPAQTQSKQIAPPQSASANNDVAMQKQAAAPFSAELRPQPSLKNLRHPEAPPAAKPAARPPQQIQPSIASSSAASLAQPLAQPPSSSQQENQAAAPAAKQSAPPAVNTQQAAQELEQQKAKLEALRKEILDLGPSLRSKREYLSKNVLTLGMERTYPLEIARLEGELKRLSDELFEPVNTTISEISSILPDEAQQFVERFNNLPIVERFQQLNQNIRPLALEAMELRKAQIKQLCSQLGSAPEDNFSSLGESMHTLEVQRGYLRYLRLQAQKLQSQLGPKTEKQK